MEMREIGDTSLGAAPGHWKVVNNIYEPVLMEYSINHKLQHAEHGSIMFKLMDVGSIQGHSHVTGHVTY